MSEFGCLSNLSFHFETMKKGMRNNSMVDLSYLIAILQQQKKKYSYVITNLRTEGDKHSIIIFKSF